MRFLKTAIVAVALLCLTGGGQECNRRGFSEPGMQSDPSVSQQAADTVAALQHIYPVETGTPAQKKPEGNKADKPENEIAGPLFTAERYPDLVKIRFLKTVISRDKVKHHCGPGTIVSTTPQIKGRLVWDDRKTLVFKPENELPFFEGFKVELVQIETDEETFRSPAPGAWSASFKLDHLDLMEVKVESVDYGKRKLKLLQKWNGEVDLASLKEKTSLRYNRAPVEDFDLEPGEKEGPGTVVLTCPITRPRENNKLRLMIDKNVLGKKEGKGSALPYVKLLEPRNPKSLAIRSIDVREGAQGHYLRVRCRDHERRSYYNCGIKEEELQEKVTIDPEVTPTFATTRRGFKIFGNFQDKAYTVTLKKGMISDHGALLKQDIRKEVTVPLRTPNVSFMTKGRYLPGHYLTRIPVRHLNVDSIEVEARKVHEKNLVFWMSGDKEALDNRTSDFIGSRSFSVKKPKDKKMTSWIDLSPLVPRDKKGVFEFKVKCKNNSDSIRVVLTDMTLVAKRSGENNRDIYVWAMDAQSLASKEGVTVKLVTTSNREIAGAVTDDKGLVVFRDVKDPLTPADKKPFAVVAEKGGDLTFLRFQDLEIPLSEYPVQGVPYRAKAPYRAAVYTDRGVYRPGDTVHVAGIVWNEQNRAPDKSVPVIGRLQDPRGKEVDSITAFTNKAGMVSFDYKFQDFAATGKYEFYLDIGGNNIEAHSFHVEEFVPERMKVKVKPDNAEQLYSEPPSFNVKGRYLFGADAKGAKTEVRCVLEESDLSFEKHPGYTFNVWRPEAMKPVPLDVLEKNLDDQGRAVVTCPPPGAVVSTKGPANVKAMVSVFESGSGRTSVETGSMRVHPAKYYFGLKSSAEKVREGQKVEFKGVVVDWEGNPVHEINGLTVELVELQSEWVWEYDSNLGRSHYHRYRREIPRSAKRVRVKNGRFSYDFTHSGYVEGYLVRASKKEGACTETYLRGNGYDWYWDYYYGGRRSERDATPGPQVPEGLAVHVADKIQTGSPAKVAINIPYPGRLLFTVETDEIVRQEWVDVKEGEFTTEFTLHDFTPNVYVSALLIKDPYYESKEAFIPGRSYGVRSVKVDPVEHKMDVRIFAPEEIQPNNELGIAIQTAPREGEVYATVAAVDEGILQLTDFETPKPLAEFFKKRALGVETFETIGWTLLLPPASKSSATGGDGASPYDARGPSSRVQAVKPVALWSGPVKVDAEGNAEVKFQVPTYRGQLRIMAVVAGPSQAGSASRDVLVRDPLVLQPSFPRFLSAKDEFVAPVFLTNTTDEKQNITIELGVGEEVTIDGSPQKSLVLAPGESGLVTYLCKVKAAFGAASFDIKASAGEIVSTDHVELPIQLTGGETNEITIEKLGPGENDFTYLLDGWMPEYEQTTVTLSNSKYLREMSHLKYLVRYPYGCIEQTTSTTRPLLFISSMLPAIDPDLVKEKPIEDMVMHGINRIYSMQKSDGGFAYWPGGDSSCYWGTAYATHLLLEAKETGYPVDDKKLERAVDFIGKTLTYLPGQQDRRHNYRHFVDTEPYMHFVMAKAGKGRTKRVRKLIEDPPDAWEHLEAENMFLLKAALYMMGDRSYKRDLKRPSLDVDVERSNGWTFWSALRTKGIMLNLTEDIMPNNPGTESLAAEVSAELRRKRMRYTTQDLAWCISGLGRRAAFGAHEWSNPRLLLDGKEIPPTEKTKETKKATAWSIKGASGAESFTVNVDEIKGGELYALVRVEGIKPGASLETGDHSIKVERAYRDESGKPLQIKDVKVGDLVFVELTLTNLTREEIKNVAMVDRFAAGFEIENPRLGRKHVNQWFDHKKLWKTDYMNMRDNSIEFFGKLGYSKEVKVVYAIRAVTGGRYYTPPVRAEAMYDPYVWSQKGGEDIIISDPWGVVTN